MNIQTKEPFRLKLSVSTKTAKTKEEAGYITQFKTIDNTSLTTGSLSRLFSTRLQSTNLWNNNGTGISNKNNYSGMTGIMLDFDGTVTIQKIEDRCKDWHHVLYTSTSHQVKGDDRFRAILPIDPSNYDSYSTETHHSRVYESVMTQFPEIDKSCTSTASKFFPFCGDMANFEVKVNVGRDYWGPDFSARYVDFNEVKGVPIITLDTVVLDDKKRPILVRDITEKTKIFCPFCDTEERNNPESHNAAVYLKKGVPSIYCSSCESRGKGLGKKGIYQLDPNEAYTLQVEKLNTIVFRDILSDKFYLGETSPRTGHYRFTQISKQNIPNALATRGIPIPDLFPEMEFLHDFGSDQIIDLEQCFVNRYITPDVLKKPVIPGVGTSLPEYTRLITMHICGDDQDVYDLLINHLAYMVQKRVKTRVAFLFQGTQGTGKAVWFYFVIGSIFGRDYCADVLQKVFVKEFNTFLENKFCILVDEVEANFSETNNEITRVLKQVIADTYISVEGKGVDIRNGLNNANIFFATNKRNGVHIEPGDRRFIVAPRQEDKIYEKPWWTDDDEMVERLQSETEESVAYLKQYSIDYSKINRPFENPAKEALIDLSKTNADNFFEAIRSGNWDWLNENIVPVTAFGLDPDKIKNIVNYIRDNEKIARDDLNDIYNNISGKRITPTSFTHLCKLHGIEVKQMKIGSQNKQGIEVSWNLKDLTDESVELVELG